MQQPEATLVPYTRVSDIAPIRIVGSPPAHYRHIYWNKYAMEGTMRIVNPHAIPIDLSFTQEAPPVTYIEPNGLGGETAILTDALTWEETQNEKSDTIIYDEVTPKFILRLTYPESQTAHASTLANFGSDLLKSTFAQFPPVRYARLAQTDIPTQLEAYYWKAMTSGFLLANSFSVLVSTGYNIAFGNNILTDLPLKLLFQLTASYALVLAVTKHQARHHPAIHQFVENNPQGLFYPAILFRESLIPQAAYSLQQHSIPHLLTVK